MIINIWVNYTDLPWGLLIRHKHPLWFSNFTCLPSFLTVSIFCLWNQSATVNKYKLSEITTYNQWLPISSLLIFFFSDISFMYSPSVWQPSPFSLSLYYLLPQIEIFYVNFNSISYSMIINIYTVYFALLVPLQKNYGRLGIRATRQYILTKN